MAIMYKPLPKDADIDPEVALLQSASALDAAGRMAEKLNDVEGMLNVAAMWIKFGEGVYELTSKTEEDLDKAVEAGKAARAKIDVGFQVTREEDDGRVDGED